MGYSQTRDWTCVSCIDGFFITEPRGKPSYLHLILENSKQFGLQMTLLVTTSIWSPENFL